MAGTRGKQSSPGQQSFDWTLQPAPAMKDRGNFTQTPKEVLRQFMAGCDSMAAARLVAYIVDETYGGQFDPRVYGKSAEALRQRGERPNCIPLTIERIAEICCVSESGALKVKPYLEKELAILKTDRKHGQEWYWLDYEKMRSLERITPRSVTPKVATTNIPTDIRPVGMPMVRVPDSDVEIPLAAACPSGEACCLVAKYAGPSPCGGNSHLIDTITPTFAKHTLEGRNGDYSGATANGNGVSGNGHKPTLEGMFSQQTPVLKPGASTTVSLGLDIEAVRFHNENGQVLSMSMSLKPSNTGRILDLTFCPPPSADDATTQEWTAPLNALTRKHWKSFLGEAEIADIAGLCSAIDATPQDFCEWAGGKDGKLFHQNSRVPKNYGVSILVKLAHDDFQKYWLASDNAALPVPESDPFEELMRRASK